MATGGLRGEAGGPQGAHREQDEPCDNSGEGTADNGQQSVCHDVRAAARTAHAEPRRHAAVPRSAGPVSYTHLTLPTKA